MVWSSELGGYVPYRNKYMETSVPGVYVAGDASGVEEATTALLTGRIAGLSATISILGPQKELVEEREETLRLLEEVRGTQFSVKILEGQKKVSLNV